MKTNLPVSGIEKPFTHGTIITKTDLKGIITYANDAFVELSGFGRDELIGKNHNIVRHPDMPPAAFADLWDTVKAGLPWRGIVKNRCKNGDHYWVEAFVVPIRKNQAIIGYMSARTPPSREQVKAAEKLYAEVANGKSLPKPGFIEKLTIKRGVLALMALQSLSLIGSVLLGYAGYHLENMMLAAITIGGAFITSTLMIRDMNRGFGKAHKIFESIAEGNLQSRIETGSRSEFGQIQTSLAYMQVHLKVILDEVALASAVIEARSHELEREVATVSHRIHSQSDQVLQASAAIEQMSVSSREVAEYAKSAAAAANHTHAVVENGNTQMTRNMEATSRVVQTVHETGSIIARLNQSVQHINDITNVIQEIAEQTNLLALNAAIEAARAGEQGRGFAVVADEVRRLAERTAQSTADISGMIDNIKHETAVAVASMQQSALGVEESLQLTHASGKNLEEINTASDQVTEMAQHISDASNQQSIAGDEMASSMARISELAEETNQSIRQVNHAAAELAHVAADLKVLVSHFEGDC